ncbi:hypothetical protein C8Z91_12900 [Paenibacillus elgii]|uniref:Uncharacterized protein n=1 Tax=Paenibacillus elgii TaxID=189691 RepID=A0A2T6G2V9_9BACL|nr:hypothetical protein C8Z91_12900 [Paenibacillus elgii]
MIAISSKQKEYRGENYQYIRLNSIKKVARSANFVEFARKYEKTEGLSPSASVLNYFQAI